MRPHGSAKDLYRRRLRAMKLLGSGMSIRETATRLGVAPFSVVRWKKLWKKARAKSLEPRPVPGRPCKLKSVQCRRLLKCLSKGALEFGYSTDFWTLKRIAAVIWKKFGVRYHPNHVWRILSRHEWSCQVPERRAIQRDDPGIAHWKRYKWPRIKKSQATWCPSGLSR